MTTKNQFPIPQFKNEVIDKHQLKNIIAWAFSTYGIARATSMADKLKDLGFKYATKAGISLSLEDLKIPPIKKELLYLTNKTIEITERKCEISHTIYINSSYLVLYGLRYFQTIVN